MRAASRAPRSSRILAPTGMPMLRPRRTSLCVFCAFSGPHRQTQGLLPRIQVAHQSAHAGSNFRRFRQFNIHGSNIKSVKAEYARREHKGKTSFNPLLSHHGSPSDQLSDPVRRQLDKLKGEFVDPDFLESLQLTRKAFDKEWHTFERSIDRWIKQPSSELEHVAKDAQRSKQSLEAHLRYKFYAQTCGGRFTTAELDNQKLVADLRYPAEWYPATREIPRTVHLHVGPTNSGKTYHALKRLEEADRGIYLGPLRLLAHEVYTRLNAKGKPCALVTGEEQRVPKGETKMWSCTVEMAPLNTPLDVAVIDEIQMINHRDRGWAWTQAFLGLKASEVHLCGEARTVPLIRELCALVGDKVHVHEYKRLTPLEVAPRSLGGKLKSLQKGDCIVAFTVLGIHALRREVEQKTGKKCAIVYGSLPPETRAQQARLFNDPDNDYDFLVASDAIGMGLNLSIKRVIFETTMKSNGTRLVPLQISEIKQIAGRAGRYRTAHQATTQDESKDPGTESTTDPSIGLDVVKPETIKEEAKNNAPPVGIVTTLDQMDFGYLKMGMNREPEAIHTAGLFPPSLIVERFANYFPPGTPFSYIMLRLHEISTIHPRFHLCALKDQLLIADTIHTVKNLSIADRIVICAAPTNMKDAGERAFLRTLAECIADNKSGDLLDISTLPLERLDERPSADRSYLYSLEQLHKMLVTYLWLSYRFPAVFTTRTLANHAKKLVEDAIERTLTDFSWTKQARELMMKRRMEAMRGHQEQQEAMGVPKEEAAAAIEQGDGSTITESVDIPQEVEDVSKDVQSFDKVSAPRDDEGEYPTSELEVPDHVGTKDQQPLKNQIPPSITENSNQSDAQQSRT